MRVADEGLPAGFRGLMVGGAVRAAAATRAGKPALRFQGRELTYGSLTERMGRVGMAVRRMGVGPGDVIALLAPNCLEYVEVVAGASDAGAVVATLNPRLTAAELLRIMDDCRPKLLIVHPTCVALLGELQVPSSRLILGDAYEEALKQAAGDAPALVDTPEWGNFSLCYTSGTTGQPKGVMLSHRSRALAFLMMQSEYGCFSEDDHFLALAPQYHGAGLAFALAPLAFGATCTLLGSFDPEDILDHLGSGQVSGVFVVPTHLHRLLQAPPVRLAQVRESHRLKAVISNAAALPQPVKEAVIDVFGEGLLHETYGSTEVGFVTNIRPRDHRRKPGSVGRPFPGIEVEVRDDEGRPLPAGVVGELFARGPTTFNGYLNQPAETAATIHAGGWTTAGDLGVIDADGFLRIVDRKKDMVVTGGVNVYPREVENVIAALPGVADVAVVGVPHAEWGEQLHAFIVPADDDAPDAVRVIDACRAQLAGFKVPRAISLIETLPRNASGKVLKRVLREQAAETGDARP